MAIRDQALRRGRRANRESFVRNVLADVLWANNVHPTPILLGRPGHKGGRTNYARLKRDVVVQLKQDRGGYCSTMVDLYGLGPGFPGHPHPTIFQTSRRFGMSSSQ